MASHLCSLMENKERGDARYPVAGSQVRVIIDVDFQHIDGVLGLTCKSVEERGNRFAWYAPRSPKVYQKGQGTLCSSDFKFFSVCMVYGQENLRKALPLCG